MGFVILASLSGAFGAVHAGIVCRSPRIPRQAAAGPLIHLVRTLPALAVIASIASGRLGALAASIVVSIALVVTQTSAPHVFRLPTLPSLGCAGTMVVAAFACTDPTTLAVDASLFLVAFDVLWLQPFWAMAERAGVDRAEGDSKRRWQASALLVWVKFAGQGQRRAGIDLAPRFMLSEPGTLAPAQRAPRRVREREAHRRSVHYGFRASRAPS